MNVVCLDNGLRRWRIYGVSSETQCRLHSTVNGFKAVGGENICFLVEHNNGESLGKRRFLSDLKTYLCMVTFVTFLAILNWVYYNVFSEQF